MDASRDEDSPYRAVADRSSCLDRIFLLMLLAGLLAGCASRPTAGAVTPTTFVQPQPSATAAPSPSPRRPTTTFPVVPSVAPPTPVPSATPTVDVCPVLPADPLRPRYRFDVTADPATHRLRIWQAVTVADPARLEMAEVVFNVPANGVAGVFALEAVHLAIAPAQAVGTGPLRPTAVMLDGATLRVRLPSVAMRPAALTVCLDYTVRLPPAGHEGISAMHALGWSELGMVAGYWYPVLAPYVPAAAGGTGRWLITPYHPVGDPIVYETADYEITIRAPAPYQVIAAGLMRAEAGVWHFRLARARGFAFVVSDRLVASQADVLGIPVRVYHLAEHGRAGQSALRSVQEALPLFAEAYGPYPYTELLIVEAAQFGGMEYSALMTFSRDWFAAYQPPATDADFGADLLVRFVVHELGHQWWYGAVGNDQAHEPWLDEALARYGEVLYYETLHPTHLAWWEAPSAGMATQPINQPIYRFSDTTSYVQAVYVSGTRFWLDVRRLLGRPAFAVFLQEYRERYQDQIVSEAAILALLRERLGPASAALWSTYFR